MSNDVGGHKGILSFKKKTHLEQWWDMEDTMEHSNDGLHHVWLLD